MCWNEPLHLDVCMPHKTTFLILSFLLDHLLLNFRVFFKTFFLSGVSTWENLKRNITERRKTNLSAAERVCSRRCFEMHSSVSISCWSLAWKVKLIRTFSLSLRQTNKQKISGTSLKGAAAQSTGPFTPPSEPSLHLAQLGPGIYVCNRNQASIRG